MSLTQHHNSFESRQLRLSTLTRIRWVAVTGQTVAVIIIAYGLGFPMPVLLCAALIACSVWLNLFLTMRYPATQRIAPAGLFGVLLFDVLQLAGLLYMTGGLQNPFAILIIVPVVVCATVLPLGFTIQLGATAVVLTSLLALINQPLPWYPGTELVLPLVYVAGTWVAIVSTLVFTTVYAWRVAGEARELADALNATELALQRETHLSAIDGLAAAAAHELGTPLATIALVAKEMSRALKDEPRHADDLALMLSQAERCRDILQRLRSLSPDSTDPLAKLSLTALIEDVVAPHRDFDVEITSQPGRCIGEEPVANRSPGVLYGLGNIVENAVDFAKASVTVNWGWDADKVRVVVSDDGAGFPVDMLDRLGEPYSSSRIPGERESGGGLGLGLFIARTLLSRSGATILFGNGSEPGQGAVVRIEWPRQQFESS
jgi:two-component system sensor histidine kinase RegB